MKPFGERFKKLSFPGPYPEAHTHPDGGKWPPDGDAKPESSKAQEGIGLSYPAGQDFGPYIQRLGACPFLHPWLGLSLDELDLTSLGLPFSAGNVHSHTGLLLWALAINMRPTVIVETGTFYGYSTWFLAKALEWWGDGGVVYTIDPDHSRVAKCVCRHPSVSLVTGRSIEVLPQLIDHLEGEIHFAFLDSYKRQALAEFQLLDNAIVPGGIVAFHDTQVFNTGRGLWKIVREHPNYDRMLFAGTPAVNDSHYYFGNADDRGLFVLRKRETDPFLDVADHGTHSEVIAGTNEPVGDRLIAIRL